MHVKSFTVTVKNPVRDIMAPPFRRSPLRRGDDSKNESGQPVNIGASNLPQRQETTYPPSRTTCQWSGVEWTPVHESKRAARCTLAVTWPHSKKSVCLSVAFVPVDSIDDALETLADDQDGISVDL